jgi:hypothetical protein
MGFGKPCQWFYVVFVSLFFVPTTATTSTIVTQLICAEHAMCGKLVITDAYKRKLTSLSVASHIQSLWKALGLCSLVNNM